MSACTICADVRVTTIDAALDGGRHPKVVRAAFGVTTEALAWHIAHRAQEAVDVASRLARQDQS